MTDYTLTITVGAFTAGFRTLTFSKGTAVINAGFQFSEAISYQARYIFDESISFTESTDQTSWIGTRGLNQIFKVDGYDIASGWALQLSNTVNLSSTLSQKLSTFIQDTLEFVEQLSAGGIYHLSLSTQLFLQDLIYNVIPGVLTSGVGINQLTIVVQGTTILEQISLQHTQSHPFIYTLQLAELVSLNSSLQNFFGLSASDNFSFTDQTSPKFISYPIISNSLSLVDSIGQSLVFRVTAADTVIIDDQDIIQQLLTGLLDDTVEIIAGHISPSGSFTTWVVNTRSGATTEYQNYNFNSFARIGNRYIGASSTGIYELLGDNDDGTTIISTIESGLFQIAGVRFTSFKAAYIGVRGAGDYILKLISGEGQEYIYQVTAQSMKSARVNFGKGLRSRFFSYQLQNVDQDFDLDSIEFLPIGAARRV